MAFVISDGQLASLSRPRPPMFRSIRLTSGLSADYATLWRTQPHIRTVVGFLARNVAQIGLHAFERVSDTDRRRLTDHPLSALLGRPNPRTTQFRLIESLVGDMGVYEVACWSKIRTADGLAGLVRLPPAQLSPIGESWMWPDGVRMQGSNGHEDFPADQLVLFRGYNPTDSTWGVSPIETLRQILAGEYEAAQSREQMWRNGARFSGYIERPPNATWSKEAKERFGEGWRAAWTGAGSEAGGTPILEDGMKFVPGGITPLQAQYLETRKLTREEVAAAYHIPPPMVGVLDNATFSNIEEQHRNLYQDTLGPWLQMIEQEIKLQLIPEFDRTGKVYVEFNLAEKLRGTFEEQARSMQSSVGRPWMTADEARARMNLSSMGGDAARLVTPLNVLIGGQASPNDSGTQNQRSGIVRAKARGDQFDTRAGQLLQQFFKRQEAAVRSTLGAKAADWWNEDRWNRELADDLLRLAATIADQIGKATAEALGFDPDVYDADRTRAFLKAVAETRAAEINAATRTQIESALASEDRDAALDSVWNVASGQRSVAAGAALVTFFSGFGSREAAHQTLGTKAVKTWVVTSSNPRPSHAAMSGETVGIKERFSNGMEWPGDSTNADEVAGCTCEIAVGREDS